MGVASEHFNGGTLSSQYGLPLKDLRRGRRGLRVLFRGCLISQYTPILAQPLAQIDEATALATERTPG